MVTETLARQGLGLHWTFIDPDYLLPHNLARHELTAAEIGLSKAHSLARRLAQVRTDLRADAITADALKPGDRASDVAMLPRQSRWKDGCLIRRPRHGASASSLTRPAPRL